jgi:hypothetical protein
VRPLWPPRYRGGSDCGDFLSLTREALSGVVAGWIGRCCVVGGALVVEIGDVGQRGEGCEAGAGG